MMIRPFGEDWEPEERTVAERIVKELRMARRGACTLEVRIGKSGEVFVYRIKREEILKPRGAGLPASWSVGAR